MKEYVLDAKAVLRYFAVSEGQGTNKVRALFEQAERGQARLSMSVINLGEVLYVLLKHVGEARARHYVQVLQHLVTMVEADAAQASARQRGNTSTSLATRTASRRRFR